MYTEEAIMALGQKARLMCIATSMLQIHIYMYQVLPSQAKNIFVSQQYLLLKAIVQIYKAIFGSSTAIGVVQNIFSCNDAAFLICSVRIVTPANQST